MYSPSLLALSALLLVSAGCFPEPVPQNIVQQMEYDADDMASHSADAGAALPAAPVFDEDEAMPVLGAAVVTAPSETANGPEIPSWDPGFAPPASVIDCAEGGQVIPQTVLHLYGDESYAHNGKVAKWQWEVSQPIMSQSVFVPSSTFPNPTFEANVAGTYTFYLTVTDELGTESPKPAVLEVVAIPDQALHIELLWHTPEDPDETDTGPEAGTDLDLHLLHPFAAGPDLDGDGAPDGWFDIPFDCFWFNAHPNWGSFDPFFNDNPGLDRDDTDGAGPENINLNIPENVTYRLGVHHWNDHGYGPAWATVRVYIYSKLVAEFSDVVLHALDLWEVATIEWPTGKVEKVPGDCPETKITPNYKNPFFFQ